MRMPLLAAGSVLALAIAGPSFARPQTTSPGAYETVKVTLTEHSTKLFPNDSGRGVTAVFVITNRGTKTHTWVIGDTSRGPGKTIGFSRTLKPGQQKTVILFLDYRGLLPYYTPVASRKTLKGNFLIR